MWFVLLSALSGWHLNGQTFLVWEIDTTLEDTATYDIYRSTEPINDLANAEWVGRVFAHDAENRRLWDYLPGAMWRIPDSTGEMVELSPEQAFFVFTPHRPGEAYYAVARAGEDLLPENRVGPIVEDTGGVRAYLQYQSDTLCVYGHWIDGWEPGLGSYPPMGNRWSNGMGFCFALWFPPSSLPPNPPLVVYLHGGKGNLMDLAPWAPWATPGALLLTLDDPLPTRFGDTVLVQNTFWFGYQKALNRFSPSLPSQADTVVPYTARRVWWEIGWIAREYGVDTLRVSLAGPSMGAMGSLLLSQVWPGRVSAVLAQVPHLDGLRSLVEPWTVWYIFGTEAQNVPTQLGVGVYDIFDTRFRVANLYSPDWPYTAVVCGKNDERAPWDSNAVAYVFLDSARVGFHLFWDERGHYLDEWLGAHFYPSKFLSLSRLPGFRADLSWPGVSAFDLRPGLAGRQPDTSEAWGTWGGYVEWEAVVDSFDFWEATLWLCWQSPYPNDTCPSDTATCEIIPKRTRLFRPSPGQEVDWLLTRVLGGDTLARGRVQAGPDGQVVVPGVILLKEPVRLRLSLAQAVGEGELGGAVFSQGKYLVLEPPLGRRVRLSVFRTDGRLVLGWEGWSGGPLRFGPLPSGVYFYLLWLDSALRKGALVVR